MAAARLLTLFRERPFWVTLYYRQVHLFALSLVFILSFEAVTAIREIAVIIMVFILALYIWARGSSAFRSTVLFWPLKIIFVLCDVNNFGINNK